MTDEPKTDAPTGGDQYKRLIAAAQKATRIKVAVAHPCDDVSLSGAIEAHKLGLIDPILVGPPERIRNAARDTGLDISPFELVASAHSHDSAAKAVGLVTAGRVEALMKGSLHTDELMSAVVAHEGGIRTERRISHCFIMDVPGHADPLIVTDAAVNIVPDLEAKVDIIQNAIDLAHAMGAPEVRVAILSALDDGDVEGSVHDRSRGIVQDGRSGSDHGRASRWAARARQCDQSGGGCDQEDRL